MNRKTLDTLLTAAGVLVMLVFFAGGALASWGESFAASQIQSQLTQEKIFFPKAGTPALDPTEFPGLQQYAGQQVDNGDKAKAYADEFIWVHMMKISGGKPMLKLVLLPWPIPPTPNWLAKKPPCSRVTCSDPAYLLPTLSHVSALLHIGRPWPCTALVRSCCF